MSENLLITYRNTTSLSPYANNSRTHDDDQVRKIADSITEFGFTNPILIDGNNTLIAGHGRLMAAQMLEMESVPCIVLDKLSEQQKKAYVIADNRIALDGGWSEKKLLKELIDLQNNNFDLSLTGFEDDELAKLLGEDQSDEMAGLIKFSEEVGEAHNYVVVYFDNELDWLSAQTHFNLESVHSKRANGKPWSKGIGRVVRGADYLLSLQKQGV